MNKKDVRADRSVDKLYASMRDRHGAVNSRANGYLYEGYFLNEQQLLFSLLNIRSDVLIDVACGSGLMLLPLVDDQRTIVGIDFNSQAARASFDNRLSVIRGDAFHLPFGDSTVDEVVTCQFFNQQRPTAVQQFILESARILRPGGRLIMVWRNGTSWIHRLALFVFGTLDRLRGVEQFPYENHEFSSIESYAESGELSIVAQMVSFPPTKWSSPMIDSWKARLFGASNICIVEKRGGTDV
jgi:ubiquinone/menaquinone biosynthesis C-methylase UbiE